MCRRQGLKTRHQRIGEPGGGNAKAACQGWQTAATQGVDEADPCIQWQRHSSPMTQPAPMLSLCLKLLLLMKLVLLFWHKYCGAAMTKMW